MKVKWIIVEVSRIYHFLKNPNPNSKSCSPKSTFLVLNGIKQNLNNFYQNNIDISNNVSKLLLKSSYVQIGDMVDCVRRSQIVFPMGI